MISLRSLRVAFGGPPLLDGINLQLEAGERLRLMGRNGTGKSTLLKPINGENNPDGGEIFRKGRYFCTSCHTKRAVAFAEWLHTKVLKTP